MMRRYKRHAEEPSINLTPLIDVVFVILIMFIVVAPLLEMESVELAQASSNPARMQPLRAQGPLAIQIKADNSIWFQEKKVTVAQLRTQLRELRPRQEQSIPQLYQDRRAQFGTYQNVKNAVEEAGWPELHLILQPGSAKP